LFWPDDLTDIKTRKSIRSIFFIAKNPSIDG
jgi:hypothetical protein